MRKRRELTVPAPDAGQRADKFLAGTDLGLTRNAVQRLLLDGLVTCGGVPVAKNALLAGRRDADGGAAGAGGARTCGPRTSPWTWSMRTTTSSW
jgi:hypothetical protein